MRSCLDSDFPSREDALLGGRGGRTERDGGPEWLIFLRRPIRVSPSHPSSCVPSQLEHFHL